MDDPEFVTIFSQTVLQAASIAYVSADTLDKSNYFQKPKIAGDVFLWQMAASVAIPGFTINTICKTVAKLGAPKPLVTAVGLGCIPLIIHPIDHAVDVGMDNSYRQWLDLPKSTDEKKE